MKSYVATLVVIFTLVTGTVARSQQQTANFVGQESYRVDSNGPSGDRFVQAEAGTTTGAEIGTATRTGAHEPNPNAKDWPLAYDLGSFQASVDPDCKHGAELCPNEMVCKAGDCKKNYVAMFSAEWCGPCKSMYSTIKSLREQGYIVYVFDVDKFPEAAKKYRAVSVPTFAFMDGGKEVKRVVGVTSEETFKQNLKTKAEQTIITPDDQAIVTPDDPSLPSYDLI